MFKPMMMAHICPDVLEMQPGEFVAETKYDGERIEVLVDGGKSDLFTSKRITAWSRYGIERRLPTHLVQELSKLPVGYYDGELLVPGARSYGVKVIENAALLQYYIFDIPYDNNSSYAMRRNWLEGKAKEAGIGKMVHVAESIPVNNWNEVVALREAKWAAGEEGLILKRVGSVYRLGKRSKDWLKIKNLCHATMEVVGFIAGQSTKQNRGPFAMVRLRGDDGTEVTVKTRNDYELRRMEQAGRPDDNHPDIGRRLVILFQERTPDGSYRHPRWDRWEDE